MPEHINHTPEPGPSESGSTGHPEEHPQPITDTEVSDTHEEQVQTQEVDRINRARKIARVIGRAIRRGSARQSSSVDPQGSEPSEIEDSPTPKDEFPKQAILRSGRGNMLVTAARSFGVHRDPSGKERRYVYIEELKKALPEDELEYGRFARDTEVEEAETATTIHENGEKDKTGEKIPTEILTAASEAGISPDILRRTREILEQADWIDVLGYLTAVQRSDTLRGHLRVYHDIELTRSKIDQPPSEIPESQAGGPVSGEAEAERIRQEAKKRTELKGMLDKYAQLIPEELGLDLEQVRIPHDRRIPGDPEGVYGLWRRLKIVEYAERIVSDPRSVRMEFISPVTFPISGRLLRWKLAWKILQTEKIENLSSGIRPDYGMLNIGITRLKRISRALEQYQTGVKNVRRALGIKNRRFYTGDGQQTPRRHLAESILTLKEQELAHAKGHLDPKIPRENREEGEPIKPEHEELV